MSVLLLETGGADNLLLESGDSLLLDESSTASIRHARAGVCEAGAVYSKLVPYELHISIGGVERGVLVDSFQITHTVGQASSATFQAHGFRPQKGQEVRISDDGGTHLLFGGTIVDRRRAFSPGGPVIHDCLCADWTWLMNKQARVFERFQDIGANAAINRILEYCDPALGMRPGLIPESLGNVSVTCQGDTIEGSISRVTGAVAGGANWRLRPDKRIDLFAGEAPGANTLVLHDDTQVKDLLIGEAITQARTRTWYEGGGAQTTAVVEAGATTIPVNECGWYSASGGFLRVGVQTPTYTGVSVASGPGSLTGVAGVVHDIPQNESVYVVARVDDASAQTALAAVLGGSFTGVTIHYQSDNRISLAEAQGRGEQHNAFYGAGIDELSCVVGHQVPQGQHWDAGRFVDVDVTDADGEQTAGTFRIASMIIRGLGQKFTEAEAYASRSLTIERLVTMRPGARQGVVDVLVGAA